MQRTAQQPSEPAQTATADRPAAGDLPLYHPAVLRALVLTRLREHVGAFTPAALADIMTAVFADAALTPAAAAGGDHRQHSVLALVVATEALRVNAPANTSFASLAQAVLDALGSYGIEYRQPPVPTDLTPAQLKALALYAEGRTYSEIAKIHGSSPDTVRTHLNKARAILGARNTTHAAVIATRRGWLSLEVRIPGPRTA